MRVMKKDKRKSNFPEGFLWGASTSSHQVEGELRNNWTEWEEENVQELIGRTPKYIREELQTFSMEEDCHKSNSKYSCESFKYWERDIEAMKELGLKAYRFSIEWSRIEPQEGVFSQEGLDYYINLVKELKENGIESVVTLWHWTIPVWLEKEGGVMSKSFFMYWKRFVEFVLNGLGDEVIYWITINEPGVFCAMSYLVGRWPPCKKSSFLSLKYQLYIFPKSHRIAYKIIKGKNVGAKVSFAHQAPNFEAYEGKFINKVIATVSNFFVNHIQLNSVRRYLDFMAINFYFNNLVSISGNKNTNDKVTDLGWWYKPETLEDILKTLYKKYKLPIMVTENGLADDQDMLRKDWIEKSVVAMGNCINDGVEIMGYLHWSLLDNFEWADGFWPKFGLVSIDYETKERRIRDSARFYSNIIKRNGIIAQE